MPSLIPLYEYDIFISYRQKDNKGDKWVSEFVDALKTELESTFKEEISVYFDINQHDGLLETHDVDASLKDKLKCLVFIPVISRTYCDPKSFAWEHEFKSFAEQASQDQFGLKIKLPGGNVANRILPVRIYDLEKSDIKLCESILGGVLRGVEFIYKETGVNRPLRAIEDNPHDNLNHTIYRNQINKVANAIKEIISAMEQYTPQEEEIAKKVDKPVYVSGKSNKTNIIAWIFTALLFIVFGFLFVPKLINHSQHIEKSIVILPFRNDSPVDSNKYFINGIMDDILKDLQAIKDLRCISRTSAEKYRNITKTIPEIAKELDVNYIVEGSGQRSGNRILLNVHLFRASEESPLWAKSYEEEMHDATEIFRLQSQIAESIAAELEAVLTPQVRQRLENAATKNLAAYENYLRGMEYEEKFTQEDNEIALHYLEKAIKEDPGYSLAYAGITLAWLNRAIGSSATPEEAYPKAIAACTRALELDTTRAEVYFSLMSIQMYIRWDWKGAESSIKKAIAFKSNSELHISYANLLSMLGRSYEANEQNELALKLDPLNEAYKSIYGFNLLIARRYDEALEIMKEVLKTEPLNTNALSNLPVILHQMGKYGDALEAWKLYLANTYSNVIHAFELNSVRGGYTDILNNEADTLLAQSKTHYILPFDLAVLYACAGNNKRAMEMMERAYELHDVNLPWMVTFPVFDNLHNEPRFREIAGKMNLPYK